MDTLKNTQRAPKNACTTSAGKPAPRIIFVDLDETLLHSDKTISTYTADTLERCRKAGMLTAFCTSRGVLSIEKYVKAIHPDIIICNGGGSIYYKDELIHTSNFTVEQTRTLIAAAYGAIGDTAELTVDTLEGFFWNRPHAERSTGYDEAVYNDMKDFTIPAQKICVQTSDAEIAARIASSVSDIDYLPFSDVPWYKFSPADATKEVAIQFLSDYLHIPLTDMIAFGDDFNDIGMLTKAGTGVAMGNAIDAVKAVADDMTLTNNEDGVAHYLERWL